MIENFPDELYQLGSEHANRAKIHAYFILRLEGKNAPEFISMYWEHNMQNQTISELHTDDGKTKCSSNPNDPNKHSTCIPRWNNVEMVVSTSFQRGIHGEGL